jgi:hypothetical protein
MCNWPRVTYRSFILLLLWGLLTGAGLQTNAATDTPASTMATDSLTVGAFSTADVGAAVPDGWRELTFERGDIETPTTYEVVLQEGKRVVRAHSVQGASGLVKEVNIDPEAYPVVSWSWRVDGVLENGDYRSRSGDDYAARLYLIYDVPARDLGFRGRIVYNVIQALGYSDVPTRALNYIWGNVAPVNEALDNAYTDWVKMVAVKSGNAEAGSWHSEVRHQYNDYVAIWGERPPKILGIAIMTDADDSEGEATAFYGDIVFHRQHEAAENIPLQRSE